MANIKCNGKISGNDMDIKGNENDSDSCFVMHPFFQGRHYVEAVKKCRFHFLRVLLYRPLFFYAADA